MKLMSYAKYAQNLWDQNFMEICCITLEFNFNFPLKSFFFSLMIQNLETMISWCLIKSPEVQWSGIMEWGKGNH